jgi:hypothetical protein
MIIADILIPSCEGLFGGPTWELSVAGAYRLAAARQIGEF